MSGVHVYIPALSDHPTSAPATTKSRRDFVLLFIALTLWLTLLLGQRGLNEPDEGRYTNIALNFLRPGADLWEPRMSGFGHFDKPPLVYWTTAVSFQLFGQNETAARLPSVLGALMALVGLGWAGWRLYGKEVAWWAMLICGTMGQFWVLARFLTPDMLLTGCCTLAVAAWVECRHRQGDWKFWFLSLLFWTLGWWTKATPVFIPLLGLVIGVLVLKDAPGKKSLRPLFLLTGILVLGSPWYVRMIHQHGDLVDFFFIRELKGRVTGHVEGRKGPIYYYLALSFLFWLPWWPMMVRAAWLECKGRKASTAMTGEKPARLAFLKSLGLEGWIALTGLVVFSFISSKLPAYTLTLAPWVALLFARVLIAFRENVGELTFRRWLYTSVGTIVAVLIGALLILPGKESNGGLNSSLREVARTIQREGGTVAYLDKYWPGMEFYFGDNVHYVLLNDGHYQNHIHQRTEDTGIVESLGEAHFCTPHNWSDSMKKNATKEIWLVRYKRASESVFDAFTTGHSLSITTNVGDFSLIRVSPKNLSPK